MVRIAPTGDSQMTDDRVAILARVREALQVRAPKLYAHDHTAPSGAIALPQFDPRPWLPPVGDSVEDRIELFSRNSTELRTEFLVVSSQNEAIDSLRKIAVNQNWRSIASHAGSLVKPIVERLQLSTLFTDRGYAIPDLEKVDAGITECDALIAQTGSVLLTARSAGGRALSVLPPHHAVVAKLDQLLPDLPSAYELIGKKYLGNPPSFMTMITGPSRTGDIERTIVLGAHGPKQLTVILIRE
jgi:L-lactate dehydrogenase complex protein LldG